MKRKLVLAIKRVIDVLGAILVLLCLSPVMAAVVLGVWGNMGRPLLFRQVRTGVRGREFTLWKFRTMGWALDKEGRLLPDHKRLTPFGRFLRKHSLDELPQLWNVLRGEMSLVGPRPLLPQYLSRYTKEQKRRHEVKPGITGWAQVNGRNSLNWEEKFHLDVWYVDHFSLSLDIKIIFRTIQTVFGTGGVSHSGHATMPEFGRQGDS